MLMKYFGLAVLGLAIVLAGVASAQQNAPQQYGATEADTSAALAPDAFSPYAGRDFPSRPLFGDTHLHTAVSVDAGTMNRLGQEEAFRFARGEEVTTTHGLRAKLSRPLDFLVVADHAEMYGLMPQLLSGDPEVLSVPIGRKWYENLTAGDPKLVFDTAMEIVASLSEEEKPIDNPKATKKAWQVKIHPARPTGTSRANGSGDADADILRMQHTTGGLAERLGDGELIHLFVVALLKVDNFAL
jgi:hypothetical protein